MKFSSDSQRRAVFRNMFSNSNRFSKQKYYHGSAGFGGRVVLAEGLKPVAQQEDGPRSGGQISDPNYVYLTSDKKVAKDFANRVSDYFKDDDYGPIVFEVDMESTYLEPDYNYPKSYKYKGSIPREVIKKIKFSNYKDQYKKYFDDNSVNSAYKNKILRDMIDVGGELIMVNERKGINDWDDQHLEDVFISGKRYALANYPIRIIDEEGCNELGRCYKNSEDIVNRFPKKYNMVKGFVLDAPDEVVWLPHAWVQPKRGNIEILETTPLLRSKYFGAIKRI